VFQSLVSRFSKMLAHQDERKTTETPTPGGEPVSFVEQMRRIKET